MLSSDTPKRRVSQAPLKTCLCANGCGTSVQYRTSPNIFCEPCRKAGRRANVLRAMEKQRRKKGARKVKGTTINCAHCGKASECNGSRRKYCDDCGPNLWRVSAQKALSLRISNLIRAGIQSGSKRKRRWEALVGYTLADLMRHLERQFLPGMTWDNRGEWHIDHIVPLASFKFESPDDADFRAAWALSNLRPLWGTDNIRKSAKRTHLL